MSDWIKHSDNGLDYREQAIVYESIPFQGGTTTRKFEGAYGSLKVLADQLYGQGYKTTFTDSRTTDAPSACCYLTAILESNVSSDAPPEPVWETKEIPIEQNILECNDRSIVANLSTTTKQLIEYRIKNPLSTKPLTTSTETSQNTNATKVYNMMRVGVESRQIFAVSVTRRIVVPAKYTPTWTLQDAGKVISRSRLIDEFGAPGYIQPFLPDSDNGVQTDTNGIPFFTGYFVHRPSDTLTGNIRAEITQEFVWNKWVAGDNGLYDILT